MSTEAVMFGIQQELVDDGLVSLVCGFCFGVMRRDRDLAKRWGLHSLICVNCGRSCTVPEVQA